MEDEVEQVLSRPLLSSDLKVALLEPFEVIDAVVSQEVKTELNALDLLNDKLNDLQRVSLLMDLLDHIWFLNQYGVDELHELVFEGKSFLTQLAMKHSRVVDVELLAAHVIACLLLHRGVSLRLLGALLA